MDIANVLLSGDSGGAQATGNSQGLAAIVSGGSEGSLFQQLISQVLASNGMKQGIAKEDVGGAPQEKSDGTSGDLLAGLLTGGNLTGSVLKNATLLTADTAAEKAADTPGESSKADGNSAVMEAILALTGGLIPAQVADGGTTPGEAAADPTAALISAIGQVKTTLVGIGAGTLNGEDNGTAAQFGGKPVSTIPNANLQQEKPPEGNAAILAGAEIPADPGQKFNLSGTGNGAQSVEAGSKAQDPIGHAAAAAGAAAHNPLAQTAGTTEPYSQISNEILARAGTATELNARLEQKGPMEFKMQLEPADLGQIDIKLKLSEGKLMIDILAANSKTQTLLTSQVDKLISSIGLQNVQVESVQVNQQMNSQSQGSQSQGYQGFTMNSAMDFSQRSHQEQYRQEFGNSANTAAASGFQENDMQEAGTVSRIESLRYDSHRMNYAV